jgi:hypothetical protein
MPIDPAPGEAVLLGGSTRPGAVVPSDEGCCMPGIEPGLGCMPGMLCCGADGGVIVPGSVPCAWEPLCGSLVVSGARDSKVGDGVAARVLCSREQPAPSATSASEPNATERRT